MSDEFVEVILGKLVEALRPSPFDQLDEPTLNAGLALISSIEPRSEMEALMAVQIVATGFSGLRFLRQSHRHMTEEFIDKQLCDQAAQTTSRPAQARRRNRGPSRTHPRCRLRPLKAPRRPFLTTNARHERTRGFRRNASASEASGG
jgi:hypothetical protein